MDSILIGNLCNVVLGMGHPAVALLKRRADHDTLSKIDEVRDSDRLVFNIRENKRVRFSRTPEEQEVLGGLACFCRERRADDHFA